MEDYSCNLTSLWETAEAFGVPPRIHRGLVEGWLLAEPGHVAYINKSTNAERAEAETETSYAVKAALLISGDDKRRYVRLNNDLGKNYLLGTDQYPDTTKKARVILGNYKPPRQQHRQPPHHLWVIYIVVCVEVCSSPAALLISRWYLGIGLSPVDHFFRGRSLILHTCACHLR